MTMDRYPKLTTGLFAGTIILITVLSYLPAIQAGYIWDDDMHVTQNRHLLDIDGLKQIWLNPTSTPQYYPMVHTTFWIEHKLWEFDPLGYHLTNVLIHIGSSLLLWRLLQLLGIRGAWLAAVIFAAHPVHVETVAWITERKNVLSLLFYLLSLLAYIQFIGLRQPDKPPTRRDYRLYALSFVLFAAALLSKTVVCTLPAAILLLIWWKRGRITIRDVLPLVPFFIVGLAMGMITALIEKYHVGASGGEWELNVIQHLLLAGRIFWFYTWKLLWPAKLIFIYPRWEIDATDLRLYLYPAAFIVLVTILLLLRNRTGRSSLAAVLFFAGTLSPALGFFDVYPFRFSFVADHFQYHASIGLIVLIASLLALATDRLKCRTITLFMITLIPVMTLGVITWQQCNMYKNEKVLWENTLASNSTAWMAMNNLGQILEKETKPDQAMALYQRAVQIKPDFVDALNNLGNILVAKGKHEEAYEIFTKAIEYQPDLAKPYNNRGNVNRLMQRYDEALIDLNRGIELKPDYWSIYYNRGITYLQIGNHTKAIDDFSTAISLEPGFANTYFHRGIAHLQLEDHQSALQDMNQTIMLMPEHIQAYYQRGVLYGTIGLLDLSIADLTRVIESQPDHTDAYLARAVSYYFLGQYEKAWNDVNISRQYGVEPKAAFLQMLQQVGEN